MSKCEIIDDYDHPDKSLEYILENVLMPDDGSGEFSILRNEYNSQLIQSCVCKEQSGVCDDCHIRSYCFTDGELVLRRQTSLPAIIECSDLCCCSINVCKNRRVQFGPRKKLEIFNSKVYKSKGLRTTANIPCGAFICEYAGELLTLTEAKRRSKIVDEHDKMNYIAVLREYTLPKIFNTESRQVQTTIVDPSRRGNIGRYLNHNCNPNCELLAVRIDNPVPKLGIYAKRNILAYEELCFHYGGEEMRHNNGNQAKAKVCVCIAPNCSGYMPNLQMEET